MNLFTVHRIYKHHTTYTTHHTTHTLSCKAQPTAFHLTFNPRKAVVMNHTHAKG